MLIWSVTSLCTFLAEHFGWRRQKDIGTTATRVGVQQETAQPSGPLCTNKNAKRTPRQLLRTRYAGKHQETGE